MKVFRGAFILCSFVLALNVYAKIEGDYRLYFDPSMKIDPTCNSFTQMKITNQNGKLTAALEEKLEGVCEIASIPNPRSYQIKYLGSSHCGAVFYEGTRIEPNGSTNNDYQILIKDFRDSVCVESGAAPLSATESEVQAKGYLHRPARTVVKTPRTN